MSTSRIEPVIYLDMDGVCADFASASIRASGRAPDEVYPLWRDKFANEYRIYKVLGIERDEYWQTISEQGESFWSGLEAYPWFEPLYQELKEVAPVIFLSSGAWTPQSLSGKLAWLQARFGVRFREYIFTSQKQQLAHPLAILIDDYDSNVEKFRQAGGAATLFPQVWNSNYPIEDRLAYTLEQVQAWSQDVK